MVVVSEEIRVRAYNLLKFDDGMVDGLIMFYYLYIAEPALRRYSKSTKHSIRRVLEANEPFFKKLFEFYTRKIMLEREE